ncbi:bromodomain testis-specific protein [Anaeramoeba flamelloides]|uniref:Bromodomain testis-specific protein n=1 Tax=Anaeramoeba flamelloides TaxID=1746091 RepID=A0ABQ8XHQ8_9EUKA|nr:bromodomain testis-specific protein [Anaeramoeba flamelloides]
MGDQIDIICPQKIPFLITFNVDDTRKDILEYFFEVDPSEIVPLTKTEGSPFKPINCNDMNKTNFRNGAQYILNEKNRFTSAEGKTITIVQPQQKHDQQEDFFKSLTESDTDSCDNWGSEQNSRNTSAKKDPRQDKLEAFLSRFEKQHYHNQKLLTKNKKIVFSKQVMIIKKSLTYKELLLKIQTRFDFIPTTINIHKIQLPIKYLLFYLFDFQQNTDENGNGTGNECSLKTKKHKAKQKTKKQKKNKNDHFKIHLFNNFQNYTSSDSSNDSSSKISCSSSSPSDSSIGSERSTESQSSESYLSSKNVSSSEGEGYKARTQRKMNNKKTHKQKTKYNNKFKSLSQSKKTSKSNSKRYSKSDSKSRSTKKRKKLCSSKKKTRKRSVTNNLNKKKQVLVLVGNSNSMDYESFLYEFNTFLEKSQKVSKGNQRRNKKKNLINFKDYSFAFVNYYYSKRNGNVVIKGSDFGVKPEKMIKKFEKFESMKKKITYLDIKNLYKEIKDLSWSESSEKSIIHFTGPGGLIGYNKNHVTNIFKNFYQMNIKYNYIHFSKNSDSFVKKIKKNNSFKSKWINMIPYEDSYGPIEPKFWKNIF